jgi:hypothetical protein
VWRRRIVVQTKTRFRDVADLQTAHCPCTTISTITTTTITTTNSSCYYRTIDAWRINIRRE